MGIEKFANNAVTTLDGGISTTNPITLTVTSATLFPTSGNFRIRIDDEILLVTAVSGNDFTCNRGVEGTSNASHSDLAPVSLILTAASFLQFLSDYGMVSVSLADRKPATPGTYDEEFEGTADTLPTNWSFGSAPSGADALFVNSRWPSLLTVEGDADVQYVLTRASFAPGSGDFGIWIKAYNSPALGSDAGDFRMYVKNAGDTEGRAIEIYQPSGNSVNARSLKTVSSSESAWTADKALGADVSMLYMGLTRTSGNVWSAWISNNGIAWQRLGGTETHSFTVAKIVFSIETTAAQSLVGLDWLRYRTDLAFPRF